MTAFDRHTRKALHQAWQDLPNADEFMRLKAKWRAAGSPGDLARFVGVARGSPLYQSRIREALRRQYGNEINVYRGGRWHGVYVSVSTDIDIAKRFAKDRGESHHLFKVYVDDVIAIGDDADCEIIVNESALRPRFQKEVTMEPGTTPALLFGKLTHMEQTYSLKAIKDMAKKAGVSPSGTKRDILLRILKKKAHTWEGPAAAPMTVRGYSRQPRQQWAAKEGRRWRN